MGKADKLVEIIGAVVLAGNVSLTSAILAGDWVSSHEALGRTSVYSSDADTQFQRLWPIHAGDSDHPFQ